MKAIELQWKEKTARDAEAEETLQDAGIKCKRAKVADVYYIDGISREEAEKLAKELFTDKLAQEYSIGGGKGKDWAIEIRYKDEVADPQETSILKAISDTGIKARGARTAQRYYVEGIREEEVGKACKALANSTVEDYHYGKGQAGAPPPKTIKGNAVGGASEVKILEADDEGLKGTSKERLLSLSLEEMKAIREYFAEEGRNPTDVEIETIAQTWSEHCKHKTFNSSIELDNNGKKELIGNLFRETIVAATNKIRKEKKWLVSVFKDNAGIIEINDKWNLAVKVETHNHPSALDPHGGASTGIGGAIRDVLGAGLGAKPIFNTDVFCFAPPDYDKKLPAGVMHPKRTFKGVVSGVRDYGNRMGIPTVNGAIVFHDGYLGAPLVYCGTGGVLPKGMENKKASEGELIVVVGGKTGRDGLHGATFSSAVLDETSSPSAVQIGNPVEEKKMLDALLQCRDEGLYTSITDCGAGGFSSAVGEMGAETGAEAWLEKAPLKHAGMKPWEIWLSESQERMVVAVPEGNFERIKEICEKEEVSATTIGKFTGTGRLVVKHNQKKVADINMRFLHKGLPAIKLNAAWKEKDEREEEAGEKENYNDELLKILSMPTVASKEEVIRSYDHEVQGNTIAKPLVGAENDGPSDAAVIRVEFGSKAVVVANGINPRRENSYWMAASAIDEALRNIVAAGGDLSRTALLDNFCWGSVDDENKMGRLVMAAKACHDTAIGFGTPFISGKDSLHNEFVAEGRRIAIPDTLLISAVSIIDCKDAMTMDLKGEGNSIYLVGKTYNEMRGSQFNEVLGAKGGKSPKVNFKEARKGMKSLTKAIRAGTVMSCHDLSEGGLAVAAAEMAFAGNVGMKLMLKGKLKGYQELFSESNSRFLVEVKDCKGFEKIVAATKIGTTIAEKKLIISSGNYELINASLNELKEAWKGTITW